MEIPRFAPPTGSGSSGTPGSVILLGEWWRAVGPAVARTAAPRGISGGRLLVAVPDARWRDEVAAHRDEILARLRRSGNLHGLHALDLVIEPDLARSDAGPATGSPVPADPGTSAELSGCAAAMDAAVAGRWIAAVSRLLARREREGR
ncbi:MAG TPA: DciA family protein [Candidatus Polarisedimenticolia bacterium]|jgi:hypothetical protein|nr:DciA family protein [Candidatus Polarisedimenticolia bacterium]